MIQALYSTSTVCVLVLPTYIWIYNVYYTEYKGFQILLCDRYPGTDYCVEQCAVLIRVCQVYITTISLFPCPHTVLGDPL